MITCTRGPTRALAAGLAAGLVALSLGSSASAPLPDNPSNPLARATAINYATGASGANPEYAFYASATGEAKQALAKVALTPRVRWFANCAPCRPANVRRDVAAYVTDVQRGDPDALVQLAIFGLWPDGEVVNGRRPTLSWSNRQYKAWVRRIAAGLGTARTAIVLEPDLAISANHAHAGGGMRDPSARRRIALVRWAAGYLSTTLRREAIYIDAGSADWLTLAEATSLLRQAGVADVRGFALGATHYDSVASNVAFAAAVSESLGRAGIRGKHAIIDTADNGTPFTWLQWNARWGDKWRATGNERWAFDNTPTCGSFVEQVCQTLGHRPTWNPIDAEAAELGLDPSAAVVRQQAAARVDGYLWFGRGWRWMQQGGNNTSTRNRAIRMATYTTFRQAG